jgi:hypothetical protein
MRLVLAFIAIGVGLVQPVSAADAKPRAVAAKKAPAKKAPKRTTVFDGHYVGRMIPQGGTAGCGLHRINDFEIAKGVIVPADAAPSLTPVFDGSVSNDGFVTGHMRLIETVVPFEGRAEKKGIVTVISGGIIDDSSHCTWVLDLTMQ